LRLLRCARNDGCGQVGIASAAPRTPFLENKVSLRMGGQVSYEPSELIICVTWQ